MNGGCRQFFGPATGNGRKDREEDLVLFHEMRKHEKERRVNLLLPISDEFEPGSKICKYNADALPEFVNNGYRWEVVWLDSLSCIFSVPFSGNGDHGSLEKWSGWIAFAVYILWIFLRAQKFMEAGGNFPFYRIPSARKGIENEFLITEGDKNDYDWLKTPPATPLFPSLEMEANGLDLVLQREIPILQFSRFSGKPETAKTKPGSISKSVYSKLSNPNSALSSRSVTPNGRSNASSAKTTTPRGISDGKTNQNSQETDHRSKLTAIAAKPTNFYEKSLNSPGSRTKIRSNISEIPANQSLKQSGFVNSTNNSRSKGPSRGVSPSVRSRIPATMTGFSDETPVNLLTSVPDRPSSVTRGRAENLPESGKPRRQSCSPSITRGRKPEFRQQSDRNPAEKGKFQPGNGNGNLGTVILGSKMVEKMMNSRRAAASETENGSKFQHLSDGFGRMISKNSMEMAMKHMDIKRNSAAKFQHYSTGVPRKSTTTSTGSSRDSSPRIARPR